MEKGGARWGVAAAWSWKKGAWWMRLLRSPRSLRSLRPASIHPGGRKKLEIPARMSLGRLSPPHAAPPGHAGSKTIPVSVLITGIFSGISPADPLSACMFPFLSGLITQPTPSPRLAVAAAPLAAASPWPPPRWPPPRLARGGCRPGWLVARVGGGCF